MRILMFVAACLLVAAPVQASDHHEPAPTLEDTFPDYEPKDSPDTLFDYRPGLVMALPQSHSVGDILHAYMLASQQAQQEPGQWEDGAIMLGADPREYVPSDAELIAAELGDRLAALAGKTGFGEALAAAGLGSIELRYATFLFRHVDVMGSSRYFYASPPQDMSVILSTE